MNGINLKHSPHILFFIITLPLLSVFLVLGVNEIFRPIQNQWYFPFLGGLSFVSAYLILFSLFEELGWKFTFFRFFGIVRTPNIQGRWKGHIITSFNDRTTKIPAVLEIEQTFSRIKTCLYTAESFSSSLMADFVKAPSGKQELHYEYHNEPNEKATDTMHGHDGVAKLAPRRNGKELIGSYYTTSQHNRGNIGSLDFKFSSNKTCGCFEEGSPINE